MIRAFATQSHPASAMLQVNLFGVPAIATRNRPQQVQRRQTRALLWRLAADLQPVTQSQLCYLFRPASVMCAAPGRCNCRERMLLARAPNYARYLAAPRTAERRLMDDHPYRSLLVRLWHEPGPVGEG